MAKFAAFAALIVSALAAYDPSFAFTQMEYAGVAYCTIEWRHEEVEDWTCHTCQSLPYMNATKFHDDVTNTCGYVGYDPKNNFIMVSFSGTDPLNIREWITDIDTLSTNYTSGGCSSCLVHEGFYRAYLTVQSQVLALVKKWKTAQTTATIQVTGHSLGAALAVHGALDLIISGYTVQTVYNFGQPRVGNDNFQKFYMSKIKTHYRLTHWKDPVPQLPPQVGIFHQNPQEIWYNSKNTNYTLCDQSGEDPKCSDGQIDDNVDDHLDYLNYDLTAEYLTCKF